MGAVGVLGKYPFLSQARELVRASGVERVGYEELEKAQQRVFDSVQRALAKEFVAAQAPAAQESVVSYALARLLLSLLASEYYWQKFARGEALLAMRHLSHEPPLVLLQVARDFFPSLRGGEGEGVFELQLTEYLSSGFGLSKAQLENGVVRLSKPALFQLLRNSIAKRVREKPSASVASDLLKEAAEELRLMLPKPVVSSEFKGSFMALPCIQSILQGVDEGKRYYASMALAVACRKDGLPKEKALELMQEFVENSRKQTHAFTIREAQASLDWVYRKGSVSFSCNAIRAHGLASEECVFPCKYDRARKRG